MCQKPITHCGPAAEEREGREKIYRICNFSLTFTLTSLLTPVLVLKGTAVREGVAVAVYEPVLVREGWIRVFLLSFFMQIIFNIMVVFGSNRKRN